MTDTNAAGSATPAPDATPASVAEEAQTDTTPATEATATPAEPTEAAASEEAETTPDPKVSEAAKTLADAKNKKREQSRERWNARERALADAERKYTAAMARIAELEAKQAPDPSKYDDVTKLTADQLEHSLNRRDAERLRDEAKASENQVASEVAALWTERMEAFRADVPDFEKVAYSAPINEAASALIARMEEGPALAYHLGNNPSEARRISALPNREMAIELGRLAGRLSQAPPRKITTAPTPVSAISGKGSAASAPDPNGMSPAQYRKWREAGGGTRRG